MITLAQSEKNTPYFVLEIVTNEEELLYLEGIGITEESLVLVRKNNKNSNDPVLVEIQDAQFMIGRDIAKKLNISPALEHQEVIFQGNKTKQREIILQCVKTFKTHFSLRECVRLVQDTDEKIAEITVYRTLKVLVEKQILEEVELPDGTKKMELMKGHHDHIFCKNCGNIIEFYNEEIEALQKKVAKNNNVSILSHTMTLIASDCPKCRS